MEKVLKKRYSLIKPSLTTDGGVMEALYKQFALPIIITSLLFASSASAVLIAGTGNSYDFLKGSAAVYRWDEIQWTKISPGPDDPFTKHSAVYSLVDFDGRIYAGLDQGNVFYYGGGTEWIQTGLGGNEIPTECKILSLTVFKGDLVAGTRPAGLFRYEVETDRWLEMPINHFEMLGYVAIYPWITPETNQEDLYIGDVYHDMILNVDNITEETNKELSILAPIGSCIWDIQDYQGHLYGSSFHGRIYVRLPEPTQDEEKIQWDVATPWQRTYVHTWELEVFKDRLYCASDNVLERVKKDPFVWNDLQFDTIFTIGQDSQFLENISAMVTGKSLYFGTSFGNVFSYDGENTPTKLGEKLPSLFSLSNTAFFAEHPKANAFYKRYDKSISDPNRLQYTIHYDLEGKSAQPVQIFDHIPEQLEFIEAIPQPDIVESNEISWTLSKMDDETLTGDITIIYKPQPELAKGTKIPSYSYLRDGPTVFFIHSDEVLYDINRLYVDCNNPHNDQDGLSWDTAYHTVSDALLAASKYDIPEIWIAQGDYLLPEQTLAETHPSTYNIPPGTNLYGGFWGTESSIDERVSPSPTVILGNEYNTNNTIINIDQTTQSSESVLLTTDVLLDRISIQGHKNTGNESGIYATNIASQHLILKQCIITDCDQAIYLTDHSSVEMYDCTLHNNKIGISASGLDATIQLESCTFTENNLGCYLGESSIANIENCSFTKNGFHFNSSDYFLGAIVAFCRDISIQNSYFHENYSRTGGALYMACPLAQDIPILHVNNCHFINNEARSVNDEKDERPSGYGGAITLLNGQLDLEDSWFVHNHADYAGGAIALLHSQGKITRSTFNGNQSNNANLGSGGACFIEDNSNTVSFYRSVFLNNKAAYGGGLVTQANQDFATKIVNCTFVQNQGLTWAGGAFSITNKQHLNRIKGGTLEATNCIFYKNKGEVEGATGEVYDQGYLTLDHSAIDGMWTRTNYIWVETDKNRQKLGVVDAPSPSSMHILYVSPFVQDVANDYHLDANNKLIDKGIYIDEPQAYIDLDGDLPLSEHSWDIGADEYRIDPNQETTIQPTSLTYQQTSKKNTNMQFIFSNAIVRDDSTTDQIIISNPRANPPVNLQKTLSPNTTGLKLFETHPNGLSNGSISWSIFPGELPDGVLYINIVQGGDPMSIKAKSQPFVLFTE